MTAHAEIARATGRENLSFAVRHFLPSYLGGIFIRRRRLSALLARLGWRRFGPGWCDALRFSIEPRSG